MIRLINCRSPPGSRPMSPGSPRSPMSANYGATVRMQKGELPLPLPLLAGDTARRGAGITAWRQLMPSLAGGCCFSERTVAAGGLQADTRVHSMETLRASRPSSPSADLSELDLPLQVQLTFPNGPERCETFEVAMTPGECVWLRLHEGCMTQARPGDSPA